MDRYIKKSAIIFISLILISGCIFTAGADAQTSQIGTARLLWPSGSLTDSSPSFYWLTVADAVAYWLLVATQQGKIVFANNAGGSQYCNAFFCQYDLPSELPLGPYAWYILVVGQNGFGSWSSPKLFTVIEQAPTDLMYPSMNSIYIKGREISPNIPSNTGGTIRTFSVTPALPQGLALDQATGVISGIPQEESPASQYTILGSNSGGTTRVIIDITVRQTLAAKPFMGFTPLNYDFFPNPEELAPVIDNVYRTIENHANLVAHHFDEGIPWQEAFENSSYPLPVEKNIQTRISRIRPGQKVYLALTPLDLSRNSLALNWGENSNEPRPGAWADRGFGDPEVLTAYLNFCRHMIARFQPDYFAYGIEANMWDPEKMEEFWEYREFIKQVYKALKAEYPHLPVFLTFFVGDRPHFDAFLTATQQLLPFSDYAAVSTYPFTQDVGGDAASIPQDWFTKFLDLAPHKPFAVAETGFAAEDLYSETLPADIVSNQHDQRDYVEFLLTESVRHGAQFVIWFVPIDYDRLWEKVKDFAPELMIIWKDNGLLDEDLNPRPALSVWDSYLHGVGQTSWQLNDAGPMFAWGQSHGGLNPYLIFNDPSVMKVGHEYWMWISAGTGPVGVSIYRFTSTDGIRWEIANGGNPVLVPGDRNAGDYDWIGVETPAVIKAGPQYHMYYSAFKTPDQPLLTMGHAISEDGDNWLKLGELTTLTSVVGRQEGNPWGWLARAEPAAIFVDGKFLLYFADVRCRRADCGGPVTAERGISLAISEDGHNFQQIGTQPVILQSGDYPVEYGWEGYSTPWVIARDDHIEIYYCVYRQINGNPIHRAISRMESDDALNFTRVENDIVLPVEGEWSGYAVRSPSVIEENGKLLMWFAGDNFDFTATDLSRFKTGIGLVELDLAIQER